MTHTKTKQPFERLTAEQRRELPQRAFGIPDLREFLLTDAAHVRSAESCFRYAPDEHKQELARKILQKAAEFGVEVQSPTILSWAEGHAPHVEGQDAVSVCRWWRHGVRARQDMCPPRKYGFESIFSAII